MLRAFFDAYLDNVCSRVKWKKARSVIRRELDDHLVDQYEAFLDAGEMEELAAQKAVASMGDADMIGDELNAVYKPKIDTQLLVMTIVVIAAGLIGQILYRLAVGPSSIGGAIPGVICGCIAMIACALFDVNRIKDHPWRWFFGYLVLVAVTLALSSHLNWKRISVSHTPLHAGYLVMLAPVIWAAVIHKMKNRGILGLMVCGVLFLLPLCAELAIPSLYGGFMIAVTGLTMFAYAIRKGWFGRNKLVYMLIVFVPSFTVLGYALWCMRKRLLTYLIPQDYEMAEGFWAMKLRDMLSHSVMSGSGTQWEHFAQLNFNGALADFKLSVLIYGYGWIVLPILALILLVCFYCIVRIIRRLNTMFGKLLGISSAMLLLLQCTIALSSNLGFIVNTDYPLPFLGGNYTWLYNLLLIGVLLSLSRHNCLTSESAETRREDRRKLHLFEVTDGKLIIYLR